MALGWVIRFTFFSILFLSLSLISKCMGEDVLLSVADSMTSSQERKYIIYDVNHGEGFNLRRDVFMRVANTVRLLRERGHNYVLVLPPWGGLYHWRNAQTKLPWSMFFDVRSINQLVPVVEFEQFMHETNSNAIDEVIYLQGYAEGWSNGNYDIKFDTRDCIDGHKHYQNRGGKWDGWFFSFDDVRAKQFSCVSIQGDSNTLADMIEKEHSSSNSLFIDRAEAILHSHFGDRRYWEARRAMRYAKHLVEIGDKFRKEKLDSNDVSDKTVMEKDWENMNRKHGDALGGPFMCTHWRRRDFVHSHKTDIPSIEGTARLIKDILEREHLSKVFLSSDAPEHEVSQLREHLPAEVTLEQFIDHGSLTDGQVSIIDQWVCSHARYFTGTHVSTFSFRIQEDREILGFAPDKTFNRMCPDQKPDCEQPAKWKIVYDDQQLYGFD